VYAHRINVFDRADDDAIVRLVADDFHFIFLPAEDRLLDQHFGRGRSIEAAADDVEEFRTVVGNAAAGAAEGEGRADDGRQADVIERLSGDRHCVVQIALLAVALAQVPLVFQIVQCSVERGAGEAFAQLCALGLVHLAVGVLDVCGVRQHRARRFQAYAGHGFTEKGAVFRHVDRGRLGANHFDIVSVEHAHAL
jgi:hypothetical protein